MPIEPIDVLSAEAATEQDQESSLGELFLENSKLRRHRVREYLERLQALNSADQAAALRSCGKSYPSAPRVALPAPVPPAPVAFGELFGPAVVGATAASAADLST